MVRTHKIRLNPTAEQCAYFQRAADTARFTFNWALSRWKDYRAANQFVSMNDLKREFNAIKRSAFPWVLEVTKCAAEQAFTDLGAALTNYFQKLKHGTLPHPKHPRKDGERGGFPHYKSKKRTIPSFYVSNDKFKVKGFWITIPKLGWVNMAEQLRFKGTIQSARIAYRAGWWFVAIAVELPDQQYRRDGTIVGIDVGLKTFAVTSEGQVFENQKHLATSLAKVRRLNRSLRRKVEGSANHKKAALKLAKAHYKVTCQRADRQHKISTLLARTYTYIGIEDLNVKGLVKNHKLARALSDAAFSYFHQYLTYKAEGLSGMVIEVGRFFASSRLCNRCGYKNTTLTLADRHWFCPHCRVWLDRDLNAAWNIRDEAYRLMTASR